MSTHQLTFFEKTQEEVMFREIDEMHKDISQIRKSMFARQGEMMKMLADLQEQINELNEMKQKTA